MESYKVKQNLYGLMHSYLTPILLVFIVVAFGLQYLERKSALSIVYLIVFIPFISYRYFIYLKRPMQIEVIGDQIKLKDVFGKVTEYTFSELTDIELTKRKELYFTFAENKIRSLNTYKNLDKFIEDAKKKNPELKLWGLDKK